MSNVYLGTNMPTQNQSSSSKKRGRKAKSSIDLPVNGNPICERCGEPYNFIVKRKRGKRYYWYAVHVITNENGEKSRVEHYLGPVNGYKHAETINKMGLTNAKETDRYEKYVEKILSDILINNHINLPKAITLIDKLMTLVNEKVTDKEEKRLIIEKLSQWLDILSQQ